MKPILMILFAFSLSALANQPVYKQLAGPPSDFLGGPMTAASPEDIGVRSKSAMLPIHFTQGRDGSWQWTTDVGVELGNRFNMLVFSGGHQDWKMDVRMPGMKRASNASHLAVDVRQDVYGMGDLKHPVTYYGFEAVRSGEWSVTITTERRGAKFNRGAPDGYLMFADEDSPYRLYSHMTTNRFWVGHEIGVNTFGFDSRAFGPDALPLPQDIIVSEAFMRVTMPDGRNTRVDMFDDGMHQDGQAGDGVFGALITPYVAGAVKAQVIAKGFTPDGRRFIRTVEHNLPVVERDIELNPAPANSWVIDDNRMAIEVSVANFGADGSKYRAFAEVWGRNLAEEMVPVSWIGGMVNINNESAVLNLDARWIAMSGAVRDFELRNLRLDTVDAYVPMTEKASLGVIVKDLPAAAFRSNKTITESMLMGPRPQIQRSSKAGRLLLVHGYCSGDAWGPVSGQFSSASVFADFNKNRSHDAFAIKIWEFGQSYSSYGVVAHSQGGAASTHLYTYYWSGLDNASGNRLIQSVGTPYQGTALAGNLAAIGDIFGAGCGTNNDLTYSGASSWLSGIPSWARSRVHYYTTSFTDNWWSYDYCHLATDPFLSDPDDGTTEKSKGQLSGANNRGHKTGWCHTGGMRDPSQVTDGGRNSNMNSNAAR